MTTDTRTFEVQATGKTPLVRLDPNAGSLTISGCSIPENADGFFGPLFDRLEAYATNPASRTLISVHLSYFNSSSAKYLLDVFKRLEDLHATGSSQVRMEWLHADGDLDMREAGEDYRALLDFPVVLKAV
jgi:hypothetical protein